MQVISSCFHLWRQPCCTTRRPIQWTSEQCSKSALQVPSSTDLCSAPATTTIMVQTIVARKHKETSTCALVLARHRLEIAGK